MKQVLFILLTASLLASACQSDKAQAGTDSKKLDVAFVQSFKGGGFASLKAFLPDKAFYKSLGTEVEQRSDADIDSFLSKSNRRLEEGWEKINNTLKEKKIDPAGITVKESVVYNPFSGNSFQAMVIVYTYDHKTWDDLSLIIRQQGDTTYLLEIPTPGRAFSFSDSLLSESSQAKAANELKTPAFKETLQQQVARMVDCAKSDNLQAFGAFAVYHGEKEERSWRTPVNMQDADESLIAARLMERIKKVTANCGDLVFDAIKSEKESEGYWIVQQVKCGDQLLYFAFLKVKDKLLLGDFNAEIPGEY